MKKLFFVPLFFVTKLSNLLLCQSYVSLAHKKRFKERDSIELQGMNECEREKIIFFRVISLTLDDATKREEEGELMLR
jgi:hypothetical protein